MLIINSYYLVIYYLKNIRMDKQPTNSHIRPNWYKVRLPPHLTKWATECLAEEVNLKRYQTFRKVSISCKNNGKTIFMRILFEDKIYRNSKKYGSEDNLVGLPVTYLIDVNRNTLKGNKMEYDLGDNVFYHEIYPVYSDTVVFHDGSKFAREKYRLYKYIANFTIPLVKKNNK